MLALVFDGKLELKKVAIPQVVEHEALIRVSLAGICNTDLEICRGYMGYSGTIGHEFVGVVEAVGSASDSSWIGKRVVGEINCGCNHCARCAQGDPRHCAERTTLGISGRDGSLAEYFLLPVTNLYEVPAAVDDVQAVFTEPLAAAWEILEQVHVLPSDRVMVLGDGKLGMLVAQVLKTTGCELTVVGRHLEKLASLSKLGISTCLADDWEDRANQDLVVEASGSENGFSMAAKSLRPRGTMVLKSTIADKTPCNWSSLVVAEITVVGSRCGRFAPALRSLEAGLVRVEDLVDKQYSLSQGLEAMQRASARGSRKVLVRP